MTTFTVGRQAESIAAAYLERNGFEILAQNYRTRFCEVDIIARKANVLYFVEVKYRRHTRQGSGLEYITQRKMEQMALAVEYWLADYESSEPYQLAGLEVGGEDFTVTNFIESLSD